MSQEKNGAKEGSCLSSGVPREGAVVISGEQGRSGMVACPCCPWCFYSYLKFTMAVGVSDGPEDSEWWLVCVTLEKCSGHGSTYRKP